MVMRGYLAMHVQRSKIHSPRVIASVQSDSAGPHLSQKQNSQQYQTGTNTRLPDRLSLRLAIARLANPTGFCPHQMNLRSGFTIITEEQKQKDLWLKRNAARVRIEGLLEVFLLKKVIALLTPTNKDNTQGQGKVTTYRRNNNEPASSPLQTLLDLSDRRWLS